MAERCRHMSFAAKVQVARLEDVGRFMAEIRINCAECGKPFEFQGLQPGVDTGGARCSVDQQEALIAIAPAGAKPNHLRRIVANLHGGGHVD